MVGRKWQCGRQNASKYEYLRYDYRTTTLITMRKPSSPVFKLGNVILREICFPEFQHLASRKDDDESPLTCSSENGIPTPDLTVTILNGDNEYYIAASYDWEVNAVAHIRLSRMHNVSSLKCSMQHPTFHTPLNTTILIKQHKTPFDPVIMINGTILKSDTSLPMYDHYTDIKCVCQNGYPAANLSWELGSETIPGSLNIEKPKPFAHTSTLQWDKPAWKLFNHSIDLKCVAKHPGFEKPHYSDGTVKFLYIEPDDHQIVLQSDTVIPEDAIHSFRCISNKPMKCTMKLNGRLIEEIPSTPSVASHDVIIGHDVELCVIKLPPFNEKYVGKWQCTTNGSPEFSSNEVLLTLFKAPVGPIIVMGNAEEPVRNIVLKTVFEAKNIKCVASRSNPAAILQWVLNGKTIAEEDLELKVQMINISNQTLSSTELVWKSELNFSDTVNFATLQCIAFQPGFEKHKRKPAEVIVTLQKTPKNPIILFEKEVAGQEVNISTPAELNGFECSCTNGNPAPKLSWQVNEHGVSGLYDKEFIQHGNYSAELYWDPKNTKYYKQGQIQLTCIAVQPGFSVPRSISIKVFIESNDYVYKGNNQSLASNSLPQPSQDAPALRYFGIAVITGGVVILAILITALYLRSKWAPEAISGGKLGRWTSLFKRKPLPVPQEEPLIKYTNTEECEATIIT